LEQSITVHRDDRGKIDHHTVSGGIHCGLETFGGNFALKQYNVGGSDIGDDIDTAPGDDQAR